MNLTLSPCQLFPPGNMRFHVNKRFQRIPYLLDASQMAHQHLSGEIHPPAYFPKPQLHLRQYDLPDMHTINHPEPLQWAGCCGQNLRGSPALESASAMTSDASRAWQRLPAGKS